MNGEFGEALAAARDAVEYNRAAFGEGSWREALASVWLGAALSGLGEGLEAEQVLLQAHEVLEREQGPSNQNTQAAVQQIVALYERLGNAREADAFRSRMILSR